MSDENRLKLFDGLAKLNILSKDKFQYFFPHTTSVQCYCSQDCKIYLGKKLVNCKGGKDYAFNTNIKAGDTIKVIFQTKDQITDFISASWSITFLSTNKDEIRNDLLMVTGSRSNIKNGDVIGKFTIPILSPWKYTDNIKNKYNISVKNLYVGSYPEQCRN